MSEPTPPILNSKRDKGQPVHITDLDLPFGSMVMFMIKWSVAAIPAMIVLGFIFLIPFLMLGGLAGILGGMAGQ